jgi:hypothetical protein
VLTDEKKEELLQIISNGTRTEPARDAARAALDAKLVEEVTSSASSAVGNVVRELAALVVGLDNHRYRLRESLGTWWRGQA